MRNTLTSSTAILLAALALPAMGVSAFAQGTASGAAATATEANPATTPPPAKPMAKSADTDSAKPTGKDAGRHHARHWSPEDRAKRVEARITKLHEELGITAAQEPQWKTFAGVMRDNSDRMAKGFAARKTHFAAMSAADNMQSWADMAVQHAQDIQRLAVAFQSVYDSLSPAQQKTADTLFRERRERHHHRGAQEQGKTTPDKS